VSPHLHRYQAATNGQPERMVSGSDDFTMFLWTPSTSKQHIARLTGHVQTVNQVRCLSCYQMGGGL
jgi:ribosome assembly protein 4